MAKAPSRQLVASGGSTVTEFPGNRGAAHLRTRRTGRPTFPESLRKALKISLSGLEGERSLLLQPPLLHDFSRHRLRHTKHKNHRPGLGKRGNPCFRAKELRLRPGPPARCNGTEPE